MRIRSQSTLESNINVTPLVDVCLVLLIIFMIVMPAIINGIPVKLPVAKGDPAGEAWQQLAITVKDDGTIHLGTLLLRKEQVSSELRRLHAETPTRPVAVRGDKSVAYGEVVGVLDACRDAGFNDVRLITAKRD